MIVDANVILRAFFPDEAQEQSQATVGEHIAGRITLKAPALLPFELANAVWQAERRGCINGAQADDILQAMSSLEIETAPLPWGTPQEWGTMLPLARQFNLSVYDAAYLYLAQESAEPLLTGDPSDLVWRGKCDNLCGWATRYGATFAISCNYLIAAWVRDRFWWVRPYNRRPCAGRFMIPSVGWHPAQEACGGPGSSLTPTQAGTLGIKSRGYCDLG